MKTDITEAGFDLAIPAGTKLVEIHNTGTAAVYRGWEPETSASGATQGVPLGADKAVIYGGHGVPVQSGVLKLVTAAGTTGTVNYTFKQ